MRHVTRPVLLAIINARSAAFYNRVYFTQARRLNRLLHAWSVGDLSPAEQAAWSFLFALDLALAPRRTDGFAWDDRVLGWLKSFLWVRRATRRGIAGRKHAHALRGGANAGRS